ncbi:MAG: hypothetical protein CMG64_02720 [Candidatus Marinimicrobia bacterium]|nr:hypothetical protein [Candidatus Neomarinimicrobiota bacterium]
MKNLMESNNKDVNDTKYIKSLCNDNPNIIIRTEFGTGHYKFVDFKDLEGNVVLEFRLQKDVHYKDTDKINKNIGELCLLTIGQFLCVYSNLAYA